MIYPCSGENLAEDDTMTTKTYARRDSATATLRKMGIDKTLYKEFIGKSGNKFIVDITAAEKWVEDDRRPKKSTEKTVTRRVSGSPKPTVKVTERSPRPHSQSAASFIRDMILDGATNLEIFEACQEKFGYEKNKRHYPAWYRSEMRRKGTLPPGFDLEQNSKQLEDSAIHVFED